MKFDTARKVLRIVDDRKRISACLQQNQNGSAQVFYADDIHLNRLQEEHKKEVVKLCYSRMEELESELENLKEED